MSTQSEITSIGFGKNAIPLHHSYLISGDREEVITEILRFLEHLKSFEIRRNPDLHIQRFENLSIDDSRRLKSLAERKALGSRRIFIVAFHFATEEAQNSLLKLIEEPGENSHFFLVVPRHEIVLSTIRSRVFQITGESALGGESLSLARDFLRAPIEKRLSMLKDLLSLITDEEGSKQDAVLLVGELETVLWRAMREKKAKVSPAVFEDINLAKRYIQDRSSSVKMILEHLALVLPHLSL